MDDPWADTAGDIASATKDTPSTSPRVSTTSARDVSESLRRVVSGASEPDEAWGVTENGTGAGTGEALKRIASGDSAFAASSGRASPEPFTVEPLHGVESERGDDGRRSEERTDGEGHTVALADLEVKEKALGDASTHESAPSATAVATEVDGFDDPVDAALGEPTSTLGEAADDTFGEAADDAFGEPTAPTFDSNADFDDFDDFDAPVAAFDDDEGFGDFGDFTGEEHGEDVREVGQSSIPLESPAEELRERWVSGT